MTNAEMLRALADLADRVELEDLLSRVRTFALMLELQIERKRPGYQMDQIVGVSKDRPINAEDAT